MGFLNDLPSKDDFAGMLGPILGDGGGSGIGGVAALLGGIDTKNLSSTMSARLDGTLSVTVSADAHGASTGDLLARFGDLTRAFPSDSSELVRPLRAKLDAIQSLTTDTLTAKLVSGLDGLDGVHGLVPSDPAALFADLLAALSGLKGEFIGGEFGGLREWSDAVAKLHTELAPLLAGGEGSTEDRVVRFVAEKTADVARRILPDGIGAGAALAHDLDAALAGAEIERIAALRDRLVAAMRAAGAELAAGNTTNTAHLADAETVFHELGEALAGVARRLGTLLTDAGDPSARLARALDALLQRVDGVEVVDLGDVGEGFRRAIAALEGRIRELHLEGASEKVSALFGKVNDVIDGVQLAQLPRQLDDVQHQVESVVDALDAAVLEVTTTIGDGLRSVRDAVRDVASALGSFDGDGRFHFTVEQQIRDFLAEIQRTVADVVRPLLDEFRTTVGDVLRQVSQALASVQEQIDGVRGQLADALQKVNDQIDEVDLPGKLEQVRVKLTEMLDGLGAIDFDAVVEPVIGEIDEMREAVAKIDVSAMSEIAVGALKISVKVLVELDFTGQITDVLLAKLDEILQLPKTALGEIETQGEAALARLGDLAPDAILAPLKDVFAPVREQLDALQLERLVAPLEAWHAEAAAKVESVSPAKLLAPVVEAYATIEHAADRIRPDALVAPLRAAVDGIAESLRALDVSALAATFAESVGRVRATLESLAPERLFEPLVKGFATIMTALDGFDPAALLKPFLDLFGALGDVVARATEEHAGAIATAFAPLVALPDACDPERVYREVGAAVGTLGDAIARLDVGRILVALQAPYDELRASVDVAGPPDAALSLRVTGLNPLQSDAIGRAVATLQAVQRRLDGWRSAVPSPELVARYRRVRPMLESVVPEWARSEITAESIRRAFQRANPLAVGDEVRGVYDALKNAVRAYDPAHLRDEVAATYRNLIATLDVLDPAALVARVRALVEHVVAKLGTLKLGVITEQLDGIAADVRGVLGALDPRPIIADLERLMDEVRGVVAALSPRDLLAPLQEPFDQAKAIVEAFDPATLIEPIAHLFDHIKEVIAKIDLGAVLQPIVDKLEELRTGLMDALRRTEGAFNDMLKALPV